MLRGGEQENAWRINGCMTCMLDDGEGKDDDNRQRELITYSRAKCKCYYALISCQALVSDDGIFITSLTTSLLRQRLIILTPIIWRYAAQEVMMLTAERFLLILEI